MAGRQQVSGGFRRDGRSNAWGVGQVGRNAATHLAGKLEIEFADLFLLVSKEMRRRQKHRCRARALRPSRQVERVVSPMDPAPAYSGTRLRLAARYSKRLRSSRLKAGYSPAAVKSAIPLTRAAQRRSMSSKAAPKSRSPFLPRGVRAATMTPWSLVMRSAPCWVDVSSNHTITGVSPYIGPAAATWYRYGTDGPRFEIEIALE